MLNNKWYTKCKIKKWLKQLPVHADFECILKGVKSSDKNDGSCKEKYQDHMPCSFAYKVVCIDNRFNKKVVVYRGKNGVYKFIEAILEEYDYCKKMMKKHLIRILSCLQKRKKDFN